MEKKGLRREGEAWQLVSLGQSLTGLGGHGSGAGAWLHWQYQAIAFLAVNRHNQTSVFERSFYCHCGKGTKKRGWIQDLFGG